NPMKETLNDKDVTVINKPLFSLSFCRMINGDTSLSESSSESISFFTAPTAKILIVDDNEMNLKVAAGLLEPFKMQIDTAESGAEAIDLIKDKSYDLVFMDHMMPVMDGVETTSRIRNMEDEYFKNLPIVALTANAVHGVKEEFKASGMNDFVAKPIEMKEICKVLKAWLPSDKIFAMTAEEEQAIEATDDAQTIDIPEIEGLDCYAGIKASGGYNLWYSLLGDFYKLIDMKSDKIEKCLADGMIRDYTIEVHALKNTARMIGATELSELNFELEQAGNNEDLELLTEKTPHMLSLYRSYKPILKPFAVADEENKAEIPPEEFKQILEALKEAMDAFDLDGADMAVKELEKYKLPDGEADLFERLRAFVADVAIEDAIKTADEMLGSI
ncbi:MAG: response regulator, partial [Lachnospiraceae bacterium]|nr:response regulator [Lachnospiraceae bacterium]